MSLPGSRAVLLDTAQNWLALADAAEKNERVYSSGAVADAPVPENHRLGVLTPPGGGSFGFTFARASPSSAGTTPWYAACNAHD
jgi:hypothetical protein